LKRSKYGVASRTNLLGLRSLVKWKLFFGGLQRVSAVPADVDVAFWAVFAAAADGFAAGVAGTA
jgi:hypothetical protein